MPRILISIKQQLFFHFHALQEHVLRWIKPPTLSLLLGTLADLTRGKAELLAENALLRQQLIILRRQVTRPVYRKTDRFLLVLLARMVRTWKQALFIIQPETLLRWHRELFRVFWKHTSKACASKPRLSPETIALIKEMAANNRLWGAERIHGELLKLDSRRSQTDSSEVYEADSPKTSPWTKLENVLPQSCPRDVGLRFPPGDFPLLPFALCFLRHRGEIAESHPCKCDAISYRPLGGTTVAGGNSVWSHTQIFDSG